VGQANQVPRAARGAATCPSRPPRPARHPLNARAVGVPARRPARRLTPAYRERSDAQALAGSAATQGFRAGNRSVVSSHRRAGLRTTRRAESCRPGCYRHPYAHCPGYPSPSPRSFVQP
jgi:hypothetical protein